MSETISDSTQDGPSLIDKAAQIVSKLSQYSYELKNIWDESLSKGPWSNSVNQSFERWLERFARYLSKEISQQELNKLNRLFLISDGVQAKIQKLESYISVLVEELINHPEDWLRQSSSSTQQKSQIINKLDLVLYVCNKFHAVVMQLKYRTHKRTPIDITDEYDVQYIIKALLRMFFEDITDEEPTPSSGGGHARIDLLLGSDSITIETKMTREGLTGKEIFKEISSDVAYYKKHPNCKTLICFIYDPDGRVQNVAGLEKDIGNLTLENLKVIGLVRPMR